MKAHQMKAFAALTLALCMLLGGAAALELDVDEWHAALSELVQTVGNREVYTAGNQKARDYLASAFEEMGFSAADGTLLRQSFPASDYDEREFASGLDLVNIIATKKAAKPNARRIVVSAHYDTVPDTLGAKDNASGLAAMLLLARAFSAMEAFEDTELQFVAFDAEEIGEFGSRGYLEAMTQEERESILACFNIDLITLDDNAEDLALCCNNLGGWTEDGYEEGFEGYQTPNRATLAFRAAFEAITDYDEEAEENLTFCIPRHWGDSDHIYFHENQIDAATICFQGNVLEGGSWPSDMHSPRDVIKPFDMQRTAHALNVLAEAVYGLAADHDYGRELAED